MAQKNNQQQKQTIVGKVASNDDFSDLGTLTNEFDQPKPKALKKSIFDEIDDLTTANQNPVAEQTKAEAKDIFDDQDLQPAE